VARVLAQFRLRKQGHAGPTSLPDVSPMSGRRGKVFSDRFHARVLKTLREVANAIRYVLENFRHPLRQDVAPQGTDPCSSAGWRESRLGEASPVSPPRTWLLRAAVTV